MIALPHSLCQVELHGPASVRGDVRHLRDGQYAIDHNIETPLSFRIRSNFRQLIGREMARSEPEAAAVGSNFSSLFDGQNHFWQLHFAGAL